MALGTTRSWDEWINQYAASHQHPVNRACHKIGIPLIVLSLAVLPLSFISIVFFYLAAGMFSIGWLFQFIGHAFERKPPEFFSDWRFLFVGVRWWFKH